MSKKEQLNEFDTRYTTTGRNSQYDVSNKGYDLSQPTIIAASPRIHPSGATQVSDKKVYGDESRSTQQANILPFALDGILDDLADLYTKNKKCMESLKQAYNHPSLKPAQKQLLRTMYKRFKTAADNCIETVNEFDQLSITKQ